MIKSLVYSIGTETRQNGLIWLFFLTGNIYSVLTKSEHDVTQSQAPETIFLD